MHLAKKVLNTNEIPGFHFYYNKGGAVVRPVSVRLWVRSLTTSNQRRYTNGTRLFLAKRLRIGLAYFFSQTSLKTKWIPSGFSSQE